MFSLFIMPKRRTFGHFLAFFEDNFVSLKRRTYPPKGGRVVSLVLYLLSINFAPTSFCFLIFCLGESPQILPPGLSSYRSSLLLKKHNISKIPGSAFDTFPPVKFRSTASDFKQFFKFSWIHAKHIHISTCVFYS